MAKRKYQRIQNTASQLQKIALDDYKKKNYLSSAIILSQALDGALRFAVDLLAKHKKVPEDTILAAVDDLSFYRLTIYLDLIKPDNQLTDRLRKLNNDRNNFVHKIFTEFESIHKLGRKLKGFCTEAAKLNTALFKLVGYKKTT